MNPATTTRKRPSPSATTSRSSRPRPPACWRRIGPLSGERLGLELLVALLLGVPALIVDDSRRPRARLGARGDRDAHELDARRRDGGADAPCGGGGAVAVDAHGDRAVQRHGPASPALRRGAHARRSPRCWGSAWHGPPAGAGARADRARRHAVGGRLLRRAAALRAPGRVVDHAPCGPRGGGGRDARAARRGAGTGSRQRRGRGRAPVGPRPAGAAVVGRDDRADAGRGPGAARQRGRHGDRQPRHRRRLRGRAAGRRAAAPERLPARPPGQRPLRGGGRVGHADRRADRQGRASRGRAHHLRRARLHERREAATADRPGGSEVRVPELLLRAADLRPERRLLGPRALDTGAWHRRLSPGRA